MVRLELPLPPSVNASHINRRGSYKRILSDTGRRWLNDATFLVSQAIKSDSQFPLDDFFVIKLWFWLPRRSCDSHNYKKLLFDALEHGGIVTNDKFILDQTIEVQYDSARPRVQLEVLPPKL